jgi:ubiquinone/menaquinone biosynthesis C-methylase UbiE
VAPFNHITATYSSAHALMYEAVVAPSVYRSRHIIDERFLRLLPQNAHILDVGSGGGLFTQYLADQRPDVTIIGVDLSEPQLKRARKRLRDYGGRITFQHGDATALTFADRSFDGVISYGSVKHWTSREAGMAECVRVLKPGGPLLVTDADRSAKFEDADDFVKHYKFPRIFHAPNLAVFRTWIAGRSIDLEEGRALADGVPNLVDVEVGRIPDAPLVMIAGRRGPE